MAPVASRWKHPHSTSPVISLQEEGKSEIWTKVLPSIHMLVFQDTTIANWTVYIAHVCITMSCSMILYTGEKVDNHQRNNIYSSEKYLLKVDQ